MKTQTGSYFRNTWCEICLKLTMKTSERHDIRPLLLFFYGYIGHISVAVIKDSSGGKHIHLQVPYICNRCYPTARRDMLFH